LPRRRVYCSELRIDLAWLRYTMVKRISVSPKTRALYEARDKSLDKADPDAPVLPREMWENAVIGKYYRRPAKKLVAVRLDPDVLEWLQHYGEGYSTRINSILRAVMSQRPQP
jgi:uncharacterized protein (DUF4415 family)